jgi:hypothetical protein
MVSLAQHDSALTSPGEVVAPVPRAESGTTRRWRPASWAAMAFPVALAGLVLFLVRANLAPSSLYQDDAWQALATRVHGWDQILRAGVTAPGYALALRGYADLAGHTTLALQLPALTAALALPALTYHLAQRTGLHPLTSALAATLIATSTTTLTYATRVKPYTLDACITIALLLASHRTLTRPSARRWTTLTATGLAALAFSASTVPVTLTALAVPLAASAHHAYRTHRARTLLLPATATTTYLATLTTYQHLLPAAHLPALTEFWTWEAMVPSGSGVHRILGTFPSLVTDAMDHLAAPAVADATVGPANWAITALTLAILVGLACCAWRRQWALLGWLGLPPAIALGLALTGNVPFGDGRTDLYLYPCLVISAACPLEWALHRGPRRGHHRPPAWRRLALPVAAATVLAALASVLLPGPGVAAYPDNGDAALEAAILRTLGPGDLVVVAPPLPYDWVIDTPGTARLAADHFSMTGFTPRPAASDEVYLTDFLEFQLGGGALEEAASAVGVADLDRAFAWQRAHGGRLVWLVEVSNITLAPYLSTALTANDLHAVGSVSEPGFTAIAYERSG